jgi:hypothetical protein
MSEEIDRWVKFMKDNPNTWKKTHSRFINAQFDKSRAFMKRLLESPDGRKKLIDAYNIKNTKGYEGLLNVQRRKK